MQEKLYMTCFVFSFFSLSISCPLWPKYACTKNKSIVWRKQRATATPKRMPLKTSILQYLIRVPAHLKPCLRKIYYGIVLFQNEARKNKWSRHVFSKIQRPLPWSFDPVVCRRRMRNIQGLIASVRSGFFTEYITEWSTQLDPVGFSTNTNWPSSAVEKRSKKLH